MPSVEVDFETYKAIVIRRRNEAMSEGDVVREALGLGLGSEKIMSEPTAKTWWHKGVEIPIGLNIEHTFRGGRTVHAKVVSGGVEFEGERYRALSPAGVAAAGYQVDGWAFWNFEDSRGNLVPMKTMRQSK